MLLYLKTSTGKFVYCIVRTLVDFRFNLEFTVFEPVLFL